MAHTAGAWVGLVAGTCGVKRVIAGSSLKWYNTSATSPVWREPPAGRGRPVGSVGVAALGGHLLADAFTQRSQLGHDRAMARRKDVRRTGDRIAARAPTPTPTRLVN